LDSTSEIRVFNADFFSSFPTSTGTESDAVSESKRTCEIILTIVVL
jgi:hypothetical protein